MFRELRVLPILFVCVVLSAAFGAANSHAAWSLVWSDEFNGTSLNTADWTIDVGNGCPSLCGWGNNELEWYRPENVTLDGGHLVLTAKDESYGPSSFTSGKVHTRDKQTFQYGRIEMRAKLPVGNGMWPAFWMMPQDNTYGGWAASGEIDIMESSNSMTSVGGALHYGGEYPSNTSTSGSTTLGGTPFSDAFHTYAVEWEPGQIRWYVDGNLFLTRYNSQWWSSGSSDPDAPFNQPFYIILNLAVGGWYTGCTDASCVTASFPQEYRIDYVRVYEDIDNFAPSVAILSPQSGSTVPAGDVTLTAAADDTDGTIATVEFYVDGALLGEDTTAPYEFVWTGASDGCYVITARALDDLGGFAEDSVDVTVGLGCGQLAYGGVPHAIPGRIQVEDYDEGGATVAYQDTDGANNGGMYRPDEGVDIEACSDAGGGYNLGWTEAGEWLEYSVDVAHAGQYTLVARVASLSGGGKFQVEFDGVDKTGLITAPATSGWQNWTSLGMTVTLDAGPQIMRITMLSGGYNLNYLELSAQATPVESDLTAARPRLLGNYPNPFNPSTTIRFEVPAAQAVRLGVYDLGGRLLRTLVDGRTVARGPHRIDWNGRDDQGRSVPTGVYFYRLDAGSFTETRRMTLIK